MCALSLVLNRESANQDVIWHRPDNKRGFQLFVV